MSITGIEGMNEAQEKDALAVLDVLDACYPGHPWHVRVMTGCIFIRYLGFRGGNWGMNIKTGKVDHDAAMLKKKVVMLAGEWLERAGLRRSKARDGEEIGRVEGVPEQFQPPSETPGIIHGGT